MNRITKLRQIIRSLRGEDEKLRKIELLLALPDADLERLLVLRHKSRAQLMQDLFVQSETGFKRGGFFVEFGATDGIIHSNTWLLEKEFGWQGIVAEPAKIWHERLRHNRSCQIDFDCVWSETGAELRFNEVAAAGLSTIAAFNACDGHKKARRDGTEYSVTTVTLQDMLTRHNAPFEIDYLSIDTEGSEYDILRSFDFAAHRISIITVEHNYTPNRQKIHHLLTTKGYEQKYKRQSKWDDWYVLRRP